MYFPPIYLAAGTLAPPWAVFPMALVTMIVIASHLNAIARSSMPASRRRIRTANGWLMMFLTIALACAFGAAPSGNQRIFVLTWMAVAGLTGMVLILAWLDALNSLRIHRRDRRELRGDLRHLVTSQIASARVTSANSAANAPTPDDHDAGR